MKLNLQCNVCVMEIWIEEIRGIVTSGMQEKSGFISLVLENGAIICIVCVYNCGIKGLISAIKFVEDRQNINNTSFKEEKQY